MAWLRTREIKPGVYETQSAGFHVLKSAAIAGGLLFGVILAIIGVVELFSGNALPVLLFGVPVALIAVWHYRYYRGRQPEPRRPGPWDRD